MQKFKQWNTFSFPRNIQGKSAIWHQLCLNSSNRLKQELRLLIIRSRLASPGWHHEYLSREPLWWCHHPSCQAAGSGWFQHHHHEPDGLRKLLQQSQLWLKPLQQLQNPRGKQHPKCAGLRRGQERPKPSSSLHGEGQRRAGGTLLCLLLPLPEEEVRLDLHCEEKDYGFAIWNHHSTSQIVEAKDWILGLL